MYKEKLKRCGIALVAISVIYGIQSAWVFSRRTNAEFGFCVYAVFGIFLLMGSLKAARWIAYLGSYGITIGVVGGLIVPYLIYPIGYTIALWKFRTFPMLYSSMMAVISIPVLFWVCKELMSSEVVEAQKAANIKPAKVTRWVILTTILIALLTLLKIPALLVHSDYRTKADQLAKQKLWGDYHFELVRFYTQTATESGKSIKTIRALVAAYNDTAFENVEVSWKE